MSLQPLKITAIARDDSGGNNIIPNAPFSVVNGSGGFPQLWEEREGLTPVSNPGTCDANGERQVWVEGGYYSISVGGGQSWEVDLVSAVAELENYAAVRALNGSNFTQVSVAGHTAAGDGGEGVFVLKASDVVSSDNGATLGTILVSADGGRWHRVYSGYADIKWSEGVSPTNTAADNAAALNAALNLGIDIDLGDLEYTTNRITISNPVKIVARGAKLILGTNNEKLFSIESSNVHVSGIVFDGGGLEVNQQLVNIQSGHTGIKLKDCTVQNIVGVTGQDQYGIKLTLDNTEAELDDIRFLDISNYNPTPAPTSAFNGGIVLFSSAAGCERVKLSNIYCNNIWTDNIAGDINNSDSDGIRITGTADFDQVIEIDGLTCIGVQKSALKVGNCRGLRYSNIYVSGTRVDVPMIAAIRLQNADYSQGSNLVCKGYMSRCINVRSHDFVHTGIVYEPVTPATDILSSVIILQSTDSNVTKNVVIDGVVASNVNSFVNFDPSGTTVSYPFKDIIIKNAVVSCRTDTTAGASRVRKCQGVKLENITLTDPADRWNIPWTIEQCDDVKMDNIRSSFIRNAMEFVSGGAGVTNFQLVNSKFYRPDSQTSDTTYKSLPLRYTDNSVISGMKIQNVDVSVPSYATTSNQTIVYCNLEFSEINDLTMTVRDVGVAYPGSALFGTFDNCKIDGVNFRAPVSKTGTVYALQDDASSSRSSYINIRSDARGARTFGTSCLISNVAGFTTAVSDTGTGNTTGTTHLFV